jgi:predicted ATPase
LGETTSITVNADLNSPLHQQRGSTRFSHVIRSLLRAVASSSPESPLVFLFDDLQWADGATLDLLLSLLNDGIGSTGGGLLVVGTLRTSSIGASDSRRYNDAELSEATTERTVKRLAQLQDEGKANLTVLDLPGLSRWDVETLLSAHLLAARIRCDHDSWEAADPFQSASLAPIQGLASLLLECSRGNPLLLRQILDHLATRGLFTYNAEMSCGVWDNEEVRVELVTAASTCRELLQRKALCLSPSALELLKTASCLEGDALDEDLLGRVLVSASLIADFQEAVRCGLICRSSSSTAAPARTCYVFGHDEVKVAAYMLIPADQRGAFHSQIGRRIWSSLGSDEVEKCVFQVIGQFMKGDRRYASLRERKEIALLFLRAAQRALSVSSFESADSFLSHGIECLGSKRWRESYTLSLNLYNVAAEVAYCTGQFASVEELVGEVLENARTADDTYHAQATRIYALGGGNHMVEATAVGLELLRKLGVTFPMNPTRVYIRRQLTSLKRTLKRRYSFESIMRLPLMRNPRALAACQVLNLIFLYVILVKTELAPLVGVSLVRLTLQHGLCPVSCVG